MGTSHSLVLSDVHFGDKRCTLHSMDTVRRLCAKLREFHPIDEIILLGDILDLQLANWAQAIEGLIQTGPHRKAVGFRYFMNILLEETGAGKITYIPGNHDYRIFDYHSLEKYLIAPLRSGRRLSGRISFFRTFDDSFLRGLFKTKDVHVRVVYPHHTLKINGSRVILTHGHFFDPTQAFSHEIGKVFPESKELSREELKRIRHNYFRRVSHYQNIIGGFSLQNNLRESFTSIYHSYTSLTQGFEVHRLRKTFMTPAMRRSIRNYLRFCCRSKNIEGVIFGHTHKAGWDHAEPVKVWNVGTFLKEASSSPAGSFLTIRNDGKTPLTEAVKVHYIP